MKSVKAIAPAPEYINENYTRENIPLSHLAEPCKVSETYLRKLFHQAFSVSPVVYMRNMRIRYAKELLRSGEYSVTRRGIRYSIRLSIYFAVRFYEDNPSGGINTAV